MGLPLFGLVLSVGSSFLQASQQAQMAKYQADVQNQQLRVEMENERIKGMQEGNARQEEYLRNESSNRVASAVATGGGRNISYEQGIAPYNKGVVQRDMQTMGFNTGQRISRSKYQIKVNSWNSKAESAAAYTGAVADSLSAVGSYMSRPGGLLE